MKPGTNVASPTSNTVVSLRRGAIDSSPQGLMSCIRLSWMTIAWSVSGASPWPSITLAALIIFNVESDPCVTSRSFHQEHLLPPRLQTLSLQRSAWLPLQKTPFSLPHSRSVMSLMRVGHRHSSLPQCRWTIEACHIYFECDSFIEITRRLVIRLIYLIERRLFSEAVIHAAGTTGIETAATIRIRPQFLVSR